jgi:hypothetical protein
MNILCEGLMYILTDYGLILTKGWQKTDWPLVRKGRPSVTALTRTNSKLQTRPLIREGATKWQSQAKNKNWSRVPNGGLTPRLTGRLTVGRNVTSASTLRCRAGHKKQTLVLSMSYRLHIYATSIIPLHYMTLNQLNFELYFRKGTIWNS